MTPLRAPVADSSGLRGVRLRFARRQALLPTPSSCASVPLASPPWLYPPISPPQHDHPDSVRGHFPRRRPFARHFSNPRASSPPSSLKYRRTTDPHFSSFDCERRDCRPNWLSKMTPTQRRSFVSLRCCLSVVSRCLHTTGAREYATRAAHDRERQRQLSLDLGNNDVKMPTSVSDNDTSRHCNQSQPIDGQNTDRSGKQRTVSSSSSCRSGVVRDFRTARERKETKRSRSNSDSDASHRPIVRDLRYRPRVVQNRRGTAAPSGTRRRTGAPVASGDYDAWYDRRRPGESYSRRSDDRSLVGKKSKKEKLRRHSMSSDRSSSPSVNSRSRSNSHHVRSRHSSTSARRQAEVTKSSENFAQAATESKDIANFLDSTDEGHKYRSGTSCMLSDANEKHDDVLTMGDVSTDANNQRTASSHGEHALNADKTSEVGKETSSQMYNASVPAVENSATLDTVLSDATSCSKTPACTVNSTADNEEMSKAKQQHVSYDSCSTKKSGDEDTKYENSQMSPTVNRRQHSHDESNTRLSAETTKSDSGVFERHERRTEAVDRDHGRQKRRRSRNRSRSRSMDERKRRRSKRGVGRERRPKSKDGKRERRRSHARRGYRSASRARNSSSASSDDNHSSSAKRGRVRRSSNIAADQVEDTGRLKAERKRLEKVRKKAEKALQKLEKLEQNYKKTCGHRTESRSRNTAKPATTGPLISASHEKDLLDVNSNKRDCDRNSASDKLSIVDAFIAAYASPVSSSTSSVLSDAEPISGDELESVVDQTQTNEKQYTVTMNDWQKCRTVLNAASYQANVSS